MDWMKANELWIAVIPGGLTPILQPLDITINYVFKVHFRQGYQKWLMSGDGAFTASGEIKKIDNNNLLRLVSEANTAIDPIIATTGWRKGGLGLPLDGSLDDWVFQDDVPRDGMVRVLKDVQDRHTKVAQLSVQSGGQVKVAALEAQLSSVPCGVSDPKDHSQQVEIDDGLDDTKDDSETVDVDHLTEQLAWEVQAQLHGLRPRRIINKA